MSTPVPTRLSGEFLSVGTIVDGKFEVVDTIGAGGFARVYKARQLNIERPVALKLLNTFADADTDSTTARFLQEAKVAAQIRHPNVVAIYDFGVFEGRPYIVMELLEGYDLKHSLRTFGPMDPAQAIQLVADALDALGKGHEKGIVHKDLKPGNLFLHDPGRRSQSLRILDFGIARVQHSTAMTQSQQVLGTPRYYAPEYVQQRIVTPALDVYQMGLILVEMLTAEPLVAINDPFLCMMHHCTGQLALPVALWESSLGPVLASALATEHFKRFSDGHAFRDALEQVDLKKLPRLTGKEPRCYLRDIQIKGGRVIVPRDAIMSVGDVHRLNASGPTEGSGPARPVDTHDTVITPGARAAFPGMGATVHPRCLDGLEHYRRRAAFPGMGATVHLPSGEFQAVGPLSDPTMVTPMPLTLTSRPNFQPSPVSDELQAPSRMPMILIGVAIVALLVIGASVAVLVFGGNDQRADLAEPGVPEVVASEADAGMGQEPSGEDVGEAPGADAELAAEDLEPDAATQEPDPTAEARKGGTSRPKPPVGDGKGASRPASGDSGKANTRRRAGGGGLPFLPKLNK